MTIKTKKSLNYFLVGFFLIAVVANIAQFFFGRMLGREAIVALKGELFTNYMGGKHPWYFNYEIGVIAGAIKLIGYVCIAIAAEWFCQQNPEIKAMKVVCGLSIIICLCYGGYGLLYGGYILDYLRLQDLYLPIRLRIIFVILKHVLNLFFIIACYKWKYKKNIEKTNMRRGISVVLWGLCIIAFLICMYINIIYVVGGYTVAFLTDSFTIVPLITVVCISKSKRLAVN